MIDDGSFPFYKIVGRSFAACSPFVFGGEAMLSAVCSAIGRQLTLVLDVDDVLGFFSVFHVCLDKVPYLMTSGVDSSLVVTIRQTCLL